MTLASFLRPRRHNVALPLFALLLAISAAARAQSTPLITAKIDESNLHELKGNVSARLQGAADLGAADASQPSGRLLLVLQRSPAQEADLTSFLQQAHQSSSPKYHKWLTPDAFGKRFGATDSDLAQLTQWLTSHNLSVAKIPASKNVIEFSGTVGQVQQAFHTSIHSYNVGGEFHYANIANPQIPAALAPAVAAVTQLNDFRPKSYAASLGQALYNPKNHQGKPGPEWTVPAEGSQTAPIYFLAPEDVAKQYDITPAYAAGINGTGQTIGIMNDSNIDISRVNSYRKLFNLPVNPPQVIVDGRDPGINGDFIEAYLDVENAGAVAPNATIKLYTAGSFGLLGDGGLNFAILRAVNDDTASVLSLSFGSCEVYGGSNNTYINSIWEEAAAQGQTVLVSTGDNGPEDGCVGLGVSAYASSPWAVSVGGTDIYLSDYATGGASLSALWSDTNDANLGSLQAHFAEQPWDGSFFGLNDTTYDPVAKQPYQRGAGGGGASSCIQSSTDPNSGVVTCLAGWPKPSWQVGAGVPDDGVRDLPDVSLFASNGANGVTWPVCAYPGDCTEDDPSTNQLFVTGVGGTSASAPAMAGIMALVNQKYGPQGQANFTFYPLAAQFPAVFNPVTVGSNNIVCSIRSAGCKPDTTDAFDSYHRYFATEGYDLASGLGTVDVNQLLTVWPKITFASTTTALYLTPTTLTHGDNAAVTVIVTGQGSPSGAVSLLSSTTLPSNKSIIYVPLAAGGTGSAFVPNLPGGTYSVTGRYGGDGINAASTSAPVVVTVNPEASSLVFTPEFIDPSNFSPAPIAPGQAVPFDVGILMEVSIVGATGTYDGTPTGSVTFTDHGTTVGVVQVSSGGTAEFDADSLPPGSHTIVATYSGDASYKPSSIAPFTFTIVKAPTTGYINADLNAVYNNDGSVGYSAGQSGAITFYIQTLPTAGGPCPTGTVTAQLGNAPPVNLTVIPCQSVFSGFSSSATDILSSLRTGTNTLTFSYPGDANFGPLSLTQVIEVNPSTLTPSTVTLTYSPANITSSSIVTAKVTVTGNGTVAPTGSVALTFQNFEYFPVNLGIQLTPGPNGTSVGTYTFPSGYLTNGPSEFFAVYTGDATYLPSVSPVADYADDAGAFYMAPVTPTVVIKSGSAGSASMTFTSENNFAGAVALSCSAPASLLCTIPTTPTTLTVGGSTTATITIDTAVPQTKATLEAKPFSFEALTLPPVFACIFFLLMPKRRRSARLLLALLMSSALGAGLGCGGNGTPAAKVTPPPPVFLNAAPGTYNVVITATIANGTTHNEAVTVVVQ